MAVALDPMILEPGHTAVSMLFDYCAEADGMLIGSTAGDAEGSRAIFGRYGVGVANHAGTPASARSASSGMPGL